MTLSVNPHPKHRRRAFALVIVLIILTLLAVVSVGFLSSMTAERTTSNAFGNKTRAEQAAQAGVDSAMATMREYIRSFPDSATVWEPQQSKSDDAKSPFNEGTSLYLRAVPSQTDANLPDFDKDSSPNNVDSATGADARKLFVLPLVSGAVIQPVGSKDKAVNGGDALKSAPADPKLSDSIDLNSRRYAGDIQGWMGSSPDWTDPASGGAPTAPKPVRVPWVEIKRQDGYKDPKTAPVVARYAFWVEDESFRTNVNYAGLGDKATNNHKRRDNKENPVSPNLPINASDADLIAPLIALGDSGIAASQSIFDVRSLYPNGMFPEPRAYAHATKLDTKLADRLRYLTTTQSAALNLSRHGSQRLNLNAVVDSTATMTKTELVQRQIDKIVNTMKYHAPNLGQRFYRTGWSGGPPVPTDLNAMQVSSDHALIYLYKIAANIRDYLDKDIVPTVILVGGQVMPNTVKTTTPFYFNPGANPTWAIGKDAAPFMSECAVRFTGSITGTGANRRYELNVNYYIELWNMSTRTIKAGDLGAHAFIRVGNPTPWYADIKNPQPPSAPNPLTPLVCDSGPASPTDRKARDADIDISGVDFPPGVATVITTDSTASYTANIAGLETDAANQSEALNNIKKCDFIAPGTNTYKGPMPAGCDELKMGYETTSGSDYETYVAIGSDTNYIDGLDGALPLSGGNLVIPPPSTAKVTYGGYLRGNLASGTPSGGLQPSALGDPRTNSEQLEFTANNDKSVDASVYKVHDTNPKGVQQVTPTFGEPNYRAMAPGRPVNPWPDYYFLPGTVPDTGVSNGAMGMKSENTPSFFLKENEPLTSIGQLGNIFDPARLPATGSGGNIKLSRGGGRTLRIGQHDDRWDGDNSSASRSWTSWRLADFFSIADDMEQPGLINVNGVIRDNGAALRAALTGVQFQPKPLSDPLLAGTALSSDAGSKQGVETLIDQIKERLTTPVTSKGLPNYPPLNTGSGPFFERGEISELPAFGRSNAAAASSAEKSYTADDLTGQDMAKIFDRGREEVVRRMIEMTTTRGNVFTVYAIGQAITQSSPSDANTRKVTGTHQMKVTFKLVPKTAADPKTGFITNFHPAVDAKGKPVDFDPTKDAELKARFLKPDHYDIQILAASSGNS